MVLPLLSWIRLSIFTGKGDFAGVERVGKVLLHDHLAAAVVDDDDAVLHLGDIFPVDDAGVEVHERHLQSENIGTGEQLVELDELHAEIPRRLRWELVIGNDVHAETLCRLRSMDADAAAAEKAVGHTGQLDERIVPVAPVGVVFPLALVHGAVVMADVQAAFEHERDGELADGITAVVRHIGDRDALLAGIVDVDNVEARGEHRDKAEIRAGVEHGAADGRLVREDDLRIADAADDLRVVVGCAIVDRDLAQLFQLRPAQIARVFGVSVQNNDFHGVSASFGSFYKKSIAPFLL